jgi:histidinol-phosphate phosphatase family protein
VFLDRDGVLNQALVSDGKPRAPRTVDEFVILPGAVACLEELKRRGFTLLVVTNQPDVARGRQSIAVIEEMHRRLQAVLPVDDVLVCFHDEADNCHCRKPRPGLLIEAQQKYNQWFVPETQTEMRAADAPVLRETNSGSKRELGRFDLTDRRFNQLAKFPTLLVGNRRQQILNLRDAFPHESHNRNIGDATDPGVADQLKVKRCQALWLLRITSTGGFPFEQTPLAIQLADRIDIGHEFVAVRERADEFLLQVALRLANADSVISGELLQ